MEYEKARHSSKTKVHLLTGKDGSRHSRQMEYQEQEHKRQETARHSKQIPSVRYRLSIAYKAEGAEDFTLLVMGT